MNVIIDTINTNNSCLIKLSFKTSLNIFLCFIFKTNLTIIHAPKITYVALKQSDARLDNLTMEKTKSKFIKRIERNSKMLS